MSLTRRAPSGGGGGERAEGQEPGGGEVSEGASAEIGMNLHINVVQQPASTGGDPGQEDYTALACNIASETS